MGRAASLAAVLMALWLVLSGHFEPLLLAFAIFSMLLVVFIAWRMSVVDAEGHPIEWLGAALRYWPWLLKEIAKANIDVARVILDPKMPISPTVVRVRASQRTELGRVIYANSITLTPGTISLEVEGDTIEVHALTAAGAASLAEGEMDRRVAAMEARA